VFFLVWTLSGCAGSTAAPPAGEGAGESPAAATEPAVLRIGWPGSPDTLNPGAALLSEPFILFEMVYDTLYDLQLDGTFTLSLAESVARSDDGLVWTFTLRDGVTFHDGTPLTAQDVVFSFLFYQAHDEFPYMSGYTGYFADVTAPDDRTVVLTLTEAIPNLESQLVFLYVLPEHIWADHSEGTAASEFQNLEMIGTGPFRMVEYTQNEFVRLAAVKDHFLTPPQIDEVIFQTFANDDALVQALQTGQVDMITELPVTTVPALRNAENIAVVSGAPFSPSLRDIFFNVVNPSDCPPEDGVCSGHPALRDVTVRRALAHATDKQNITDVAVLGQGTPGITLIPDGLGVWFNNTLEDYAFDIDAANQLLDDAGYADTDGDGVRELPDGSQPLVFRLQWPNDIPEAPRIAELLGQTWAQIGVQTEPQAMDPNALTAACCPTFDYDIMLWGWSSDPDPAFLLSVATSAEITTGFSETGYSNPEYDDLYMQQAVELDPERRRDLVWEMQEILHRDVVYLVPYYQTTVQAYRTDRFQGWITDAPKLALEDVTSLVVVEPVK
jgi:peptide/nickel transport system substrate-binding protein